MYGVTGEVTQEVKNAVEKINSLSTVKIVINETSATNHGNGVRVKETFATDLLAVKDMADEFYKAVDAGRHNYIRLWVVPTCLIWIWVGFGVWWDANYMWMQCSFRTIYYIAWLQFLFSTIGLHGSNGAGTLDKLWEFGSGKEIEYWLCYIYRAGSFSTISWIIFPLKNSLKTVRFYYLHLIRDRRKTISPLRPLRWLHSNSSR